jgi:hypothetical protein
MIQYVYCFTKVLDVGGAERLKSLFDSLSGLLLYGYPSRFKAKVRNGEKLPHALTKMKRYLDFKDNFTSFCCVFTACH